MAININKLGLRIDGWADLIEGAAEKEESARQSLEQLVREKGLPNVTINPTFVTPTYGKKQRKYIVLEASNGATVAAYIGAFGKDLYAKWDVFVRPLLNKQVLYGILAFGALSGLWVGISGASQTNPWTGETHFSFGGLVAGLIGGLIMGVILGTGVVAGAGMILRRNILTFFFKQLDEFDLDDITALTLAAHKAMLHALDAVGIDLQALRIKEQFAAGSRDRLI